MHATILIADDEKIIRESMARVLSEQGHKVVMAQDGEEALKRLSEMRLTVALLDIRMPKLDGMEVLKQAQTICPQTYIIVITAYGTIENAVAAMQAGASDYVTKPFVFEEVIT